MTIYKTFGLISLLLFYVFFDSAAETSAINLNEFTGCWTFSRVPGFSLVIVPDPALSTVCSGRMDSLLLVANIRTAIPITNDNSTDTIKIEFLRFIVFINQTFFRDRSEVA